MSALPNFFIVGAPKAGTTSLYRYLDQHPQVYMSPIKEPCYFASEIRPENFSEALQPMVRRGLKDLDAYLAGPMLEKRPGALGLDWESYLKLFRNVKDEKAIGEASVVYLWSRTAARNIFSKIPDARILMVLRNPVETAFSHYLHSVTSGIVRCSFREQIQSDLRHQGGKFEKAYPILEFGLYYEQVKRYLDLFPKANIRIYLYEQYRAQPAQMMADILRFLNVDWTLAVDMSEEYNAPRIPRHIAIGYFLKKLGLWQLAKKLAPEAVLPRLRALVFRPRKLLVMDPGDRRYLIDYYREDVQKLSGLLDRDLRAWVPGD